MKKYFGTTIFHFLLFYHNDSKIETFAKNVCRNELRVVSKNILVDNLFWFEIFVIHICVLFYNSTVPGNSNCPTSFRINVRTKYYETLMYFAFITSKKNVH